MDSVQGGIYARHVLVVLFIIAFWVFQIKKVQPDFNNIEFLLQETFILESG